VLCIACQHISTGTDECSAEARVACLHGSTGTDECSAEPRVACLHSSAGRDQCSAESSVAVSTAVQEQTSSLQRREFKDNSRKHFTQSMGALSIQVCKNIKLFLKVPFHGFIISVHEIKTIASLTMCITLIFRMFHSMLLTRLDGKAILPLAPDFILSFRITCRRAI
jgi:hypothetical protein